MTGVSSYTDDRTVSICFPERAILESIYALSVWTATGRESSTQIAHHTSKVFALELLVIPFLCVNMCLCQVRVEQEEKQVHRQLWQAITPRLV